jgi:hypothetical protein
MTRKEGSNNELIMQNSCDTYLTSSTIAIRAVALSGLADHSPPLALSAPLQSYMCFRRNILTWHRNLIKYNRSGHFHASSAAYSQDRTLVALLEVRTQRHHRPMIYARYLRKMQYTSHAVLVFPTPIMACSNMCRPRGEIISSHRSSWLQQTTTSTPKTRSQLPTLSRTIHERKNHVCLHYH